ncbi:MAG: glycosyltransferase [Lachnospiraceae bacterium]|nr:glycosyltransferase [Lachnospiraceae bacterium]
MKVLVVSQPVFSNTNNMGKTLKGYFSCFQPSEIAQLYLRNGIPTELSSCENYYRFSDEDALKSILNRRIHGKRFDKENITLAKDIDKNRKAASDLQPEGMVYKMKSKHKAWMLLLRDMMHDLSNWKNEDLLIWVREMNPDIIFFAAGDSAFSYKITDYIARKMKKPLVVGCMDDFYINNQNKNDFLGRFRQNQFMKVVKKTMEDADALFTICDSMNRVYHQMFQRKCYTLHTPAVKREIILDEKAHQISYIGNVGCGRVQSLLEIGQALSEVNSEELPGYVDVYSGTKQPEYIEKLRQAPGIRFHGAISPEQVLEVMGHSMAVIHTESFDTNMMERVRFSVSTKIAESLMYGPCLLAYGPKGIASIDYLKENHAAYVISSRQKLKQGLQELLGNAKLRNEILKNARVLAEKNHDGEKNPGNVRKWLSEIAAQRIVSNDL